MHATAWPEELEVSPGEVARYTVTVTNTSNVIDAYRVQVFGIDPKWVTTAPAQLSLFPGDVDTMEVSIALPVDYPASRRRLALTVRSENDPAEFALAHAEIGVTPTSQIDVTIDPPMMQGGRRARFGIVVANTGNATIAATPIAVDPEDLSEWEFVPSVTEIPAGESRVVQVMARGGRAWLGNPRARVFELGVETDEQIVRPATFIQRPRIGRWLISLLGLLAAAAVFALVLSRAFDSVVDEASVDDELLEDALKDEETDAGPGLAIDPATVTGSVKSQTSEMGVPGIQAELFVADDTTVVFASAVTDENGTYTFGGLGSNTYKVRFTGAGFNPVWYEAGPTADAALEVPVEAGDPVPPLNDIFIGGRPGSLSGMVISGDPSGALATLVVEGRLDATEPIVDQVEVSADGSFVFEAVPSPAVYALRVEKLGFATESRQITLNAGQPLTGVEVSLRPDDGVITGEISDVSGPLGGATVVATDGTNTIETVSLTVQENRGWYQLRNLAVPGRYTITISRPGYATESRNVVLGESSFPTVNVQLVPALGSVAGVTNDGSGAPLSGVTVRVAGAGFEASTTSISQEGPEGRFFLDDVPIPGSYTMTFTKAGYASRVLLVELDARLGTANTDDLRIALTQSTATLSGTVTDLDRVPLAGATVTLKAGDLTYRQISADREAGGFSFTGVPAGSYTLTASRSGSSDTVIPVTLTAGAQRFEVLRLGEQAAITGTVVIGTIDGGGGPDSPPAAGKTVRLFRTVDFPNGGTATLAGIPIADQVTDIDGRFAFSPVDANQLYIVAVYSEPNAADGDPLDSVEVQSLEALAVDIGVAARVLVIGVVG